MKLARFAVIALVLASALTAPAAAQYDPTHDPYAGNFDAVASQCSHWAVITPSDSTDLATYPKAVYVGTTGNVTMIGARAPSGASGVAWKNVPSSSLLPARPRRILATGTTATDILGCY